MRILEIRRVSGVKHSFRSGVLIVAHQQSLNLYSYVENNPTTTGDPDGHGDWYSPNGRRLGSDGINDRLGACSQRCNNVSFRHACRKHT
jgi:hypothetical protein